MKPAVAAFDQFSADYDRWFDTNQDIYKGQLSCLRSHIPSSGTGLEIGAGSGRFAAPLKIRYCLDPSRQLLLIARQRGMETVQGTGESLPWRCGVFDFVLMMTVICFMDSPDEAFCEACRVLRPGGTLIIGFFDRNGEIARQEEMRSPRGQFLRYAKFWSADEVRRSLARSGFTAGEIREDLHGISLAIAQKESHP
ncbi:MAG: class I SAM-dependent methyltransferase [Methanoregula sp.]